jgi:EAL domain-containing protein (putative c-di-GMP-specific phosphodiesterase class I)
LQTLHGLGTRISIDDFGTGYSSLHYIARLPIDALKVDRSFVNGITESAESLAIVKSIISIAKALQLIVVAEGVENEEQMALLRKLECDELQGYYLGRPQPPDETLNVIRTLS